METDQNVRRTRRLIPIHIYNSVITEIAIHFSECAGAVAAAAVESAAFFSPAVAGRDFLPWQQLVCWREVYHSGSAGLRVCVCARRDAGP